VFGRQGILVSLVKAIVPFAPMPADLPRARDPRVAPAAGGRFSLAQCARMGSAPITLFTVEHTLALYLFLAAQFSRRGAVVAADDATVWCVGRCAPGAGWGLGRRRKGDCAQACVAVR
jgi:hypothetical protein